MKKLIKQLANRLFWWATEDVYDEGMEFGAVVGMRIERADIIKKLEATDSACAAWAIAVIKDEL